MKRTILLLVLILASPMTAAACPPLLDLKLPTLTEDAASLCRYQGKVLLVVNTASQCGYTPQYEGLEKLHRRYKDKGLVVIGLPVERFRRAGAGLEQGDREFCEVNYGVSFPMFAKSAVAKGTVNPFYERLALASKSRPRWNFHKYLVDRKGEKVLAYESAVDAERSEVRQGDRAPAGAALSRSQRLWISAMMLPSLSLNHAALAPPAVVMPFSSVPGMSYLSKVTPRAFSAATSRSTSSTCQNAWLACDVPAFGVGYRKHAVPLPNS